MSPFKKESKIPASVGLIKRASAILEKESDLINITKKLIEFEKFKNLILTED